MLGLGLSLTKVAIAGEGAGGGAALPTPYALWDAGAGNATRGAIPNATTLAALPNNILRTQNGVLYSNIPTASGATVSAITGYLRSVSTNTTGLTQMVSIRLAAGTYTLSMDAKSHDGVSTYNTFFGTTTSNASKAIGPVEATISHTFTVAVTGTVTLALAYRNTTGDAYDINFRNVRLHAGSSDLGADVHAAHMMLGLSDADSNNPTFSDKTYRQAGLALLPATASISAFTIVASVNQAGATGGSPAGILGGDSYLGLQFGSKNNTLHARITSGTMDSQYGRLRNNGWLVVAVRVQNGLQELFVNGALVYRGVASFSAYSLNALYTGYLGTVGGSTFPTGDKLHTIAMYDSALSDDDLQNVISDLKTRLTRDGLTPATTAIKYSYHAGGDSLTFDGSQVGASGTGSYARRWFTTNANAIGEVFAVNSTGISDLTTKVAQRAAMWERQISLGTTPIVSVLTGVNDTVDVGTWLPQYYAAGAAIRATGAKAIALPVPPKGVAGSAHNLARAPVNDAMASGWSSYFDAFVDLRTNNAYLDAAPSGGVYYQVDQVHWNGAGYDEITPSIHSAIQALVDAL